MYEANTAFRHRKGARLGERFKGPNKQALEAEAHRPGPDGHPQGAALARWWRGRSDRARGTTRTICRSKARRSGAAVSAVAQQVPATARSWPSSMAGPRRSRAPRRRLRSSTSLGLHGGAACWSLRRDTDKTSWYTSRCAMFPRVDVRPRWPIINAFAGAPTPQAPGPDPRRFRRSSRSSMRDRRQRSRHSIREGCGELTPWPIQTSTTTLIEKPLVTEKSTVLQDIRNQYSFKVRTATRTSRRSARPWRPCSRCVSTRCGS